MRVTSRVWVALGSNLGDSKNILQQAWRQLGNEETVELVCLSHPYITEPVGMESSNLFLNAVGILETALSPDSLLILLQRVETEFGRKRKTAISGYEDRLLDLDILYYDGRIMTSGNLVLPHPHIAERLFVLEPFAEVDPDHCDPANGLTTAAMRQNLLRQMKEGTVAGQEIRRDTWA